jgi:hypothetical protein
MRGRLLRAIFLIYPRTWRERYGDEVGELTDELAATNQTPSWRLALGLVLSALVERARSWRPRQWIAYTSACVVLVAIVLVSLSTTASRPTHTSARVTSVHEVRRVVVLNPGTGNVVSSTKVAFAQVKCIVTLNPKTGAVLSAEPVGGNPTGCSAYLSLPNDPTVNSNR